MYSQVYPRGEYPSFDCRLMTPFNMMISGPTQSGKTTFACNLLKSAEDLFLKKPDYVLLYYMEEQSKYDHMMEKGLIHEMVNLSTIDDLSYQETQEKVLPFKNGNGSMVIFDDTISEINKDCERMFTTLGHHTNTSLVLMTQNLFYSHPSFRIISLNSQYITVMKNARDLRQLTHLASQLCPRDPQFVTSAYEAATINNPYSYLFIDASPQARSELQLRTNIFAFKEGYGEENYPLIVFPKRD